jgi:hypothetical protein
MKQEDFMNRVNNYIKEYNKTCVDELDDEFIESRNKIVYYLYRFIYSNMDNLFESSFTFIKTLNERVEENLKNCKILYEEFEEISMEKEKFYLNLIILCTNLLNEIELRQMKIHATIVKDVFKNLQHNNNNK